MGEHREGDVSVPGVVLPDLVFVESDFVFGGSEAFFDWPACAGHVDEFAESGARTTTRSYICAACRQSWTKA